MKAQRQQVEQEIAALRAQIAQAETGLSLQRKDLAANQKLEANGFISPTRVAQIEAGVVDYAAKLEERRSELARAIRATYGSSTSHIGTICTRL